MDFLISRVLSSFAQSRGGRGGRPRRVDDGPREPAAAVGSTSSIWDSAGVVSAWAMICRSRSVQRSRCLERRGRRGPGGRGVSTRDHPNGGCGTGRSPVADQLRVALELSPTDNMRTRVNGTDAAGAARARRTSGAASYRRLRGALRRVAPRRNSRPTSWRRVIARVERGDSGSLVGLAPPGEAPEIPTQRPKLTDVGQRSKLSDVGQRSKLSNVGQSVAAPSLVRRL